MPESRLTIGLDRRIRIDWLDATLQMKLEQIPPKELKRRIDLMLEGQVTGSAANSARGKTRTVLLHIWENVADRKADLRDRALTIAQDCPREKWITLHWGMCMATYPFFLDFATSAGRVLALRDVITSRQIHSRIAENWGVRTTVTRAVQRLLRSLVDWNVLTDSEVKGSYLHGSRVDLTKEPDIELWLLEALMIGSGTRRQSLQELVSAAPLFPFTCEVGPHMFGHFGALDIESYGSGQNHVVLR